MSLHLVDAELVTSSLEWSVQVLVDDGGSFLVCDEAAWEYKSVGIVVLTDEVSNLHLPSQAGANAVVLVQRHCHTFTATADADTGAYDTGFDVFSEWVGKVRIVAGHITVRAVVFVLNTLLFEVLLNELLQRKAGMV